MTTRSVLLSYTPTQARAFAATADYLEATFELSQLPNTADETLRSLARKRFRELRDFAMQSLTKAGLPGINMGVARQIIKERREHRRHCAQLRRQRREEREKFLTQ